MDLVADIGATNARFQRCDGSRLVGDPVVLATREFSSARDLLRAVKDAFEPFTPERVLLAIAGPRQPAGAIEVTNTGLLISAADAAGVFACDADVVNDFYALAHGVPFFAQLEQIGGSDAGLATKALLGPGTGLGMATILPAESTGAWRVLASEGGHADLAPGSHLEAELWGLLLAEHGHVCWETVLCGSGLTHLYSAMCTLWGSAAEDLSPAEITERGLAMSDPVCHQCLETFCGLLGSAAGNLALTVTATGGVYIGGGIVPRMVDFLRQSPFRRRFEERGALSEFVAQIPVLVINDADPGLIGAAHCLHPAAG